MEALFLPDPLLLFQEMANINPEDELMNEEVVEILSDDEDESNDDEQPVSSMSPNAKRTVIIDSSDEENDIEDLDTWYELKHHSPEATRMKRRKHNYTSDSDQHGERIYPSNFMDLITSMSQPSTSNNCLPSPAKTPIARADPEATKDCVLLSSRPKAAFSQVDMRTQPASPERSRRSVEVSDNIADKGKAKREMAPFYDDPKFGVRMYCGPGFERFPLVLGTIAEHSDVCDKWILMEAKKREYHKSGRVCQAEPARYVGNPLDGSESDDDQTDISEEMIVEMDLLQRLREVLPDVQRGFALERIRAQVRVCCIEGDEDVRMQPNVTDIISQILESPDYPRQDKTKQTGEPAVDGTGVTIPWRKGDPENKTYHRDAVCLLAGHFDHIPTHFIYKSVQEKRSLFDAYLYIHSLDQEYEATSSKERLYRRSINPRMALEKKYTLKDTSLRSKEQWNNTVNEFQAAKQQAERKKLQRQQEKERQALEEANLQEHKASGAIIECQCCFDEEIPVNRAVSCENQDMHWFCFSCVSSLAENQVGLMKHEMLCMHQDGCKANLALAGVKSAITGKLYEKLGFYQQQSEITAACIEGLEQCPFCDFKAICDPPEISSVFQCQNPDCQGISCRKCHEDSHLPKSCEEVSVDRRLSARHQVEEARSEAMMRPCPRCKVKIIKEIGCNKMRCSKCGCVMCYVCKTDISSRRDGGYGHFNDSGAKCVLYDKNFDRHEAEADEAEREAIKRVQQENEDIDEKQLQIETGTKKSKSLPPKDVLGFGWGQGIRPMRRHRRPEALEATLQQHRHRTNEAYQMILKDQQAQAQNRNQIAASANVIHASDPFHNQPQKPVPVGTVLGARGLPNHLLFEEQQLVGAPQAPPVPQRFPTYNQLGVPQQAAPKMEFGWQFQEDIRRWRAVQPETMPPPQQLQPTQVTAQGGFADMFQHYLPQNNMFLPGMMDLEQQAVIYEMTAQPMNQNGVNRMPHIEGHVIRRHASIASNSNNERLGQQQHLALQQTPTQQQQQPQQLFANGEMLVNDMNFFPHLHSSNMGLAFHDFGNGIRGGWQGAMMNQPSRHPGTGYFADGVQPGPAYQNSFQPYPDVYS